MEETVNENILGIMGGMVSTKSFWWVSYVYIYNDLSVKEVGLVVMMMVYYKKVPYPGIEPGPSGWKPDILTI